MEVKSSYPSKALVPYDFVYFKVLYKNRMEKVRSS